MAHEIGHEYFWVEEEAGYPTLRQRNFFVRTLLKMQRSGFNKEGWQTASVGK
jgi:hypothetical protein